MEERLIIAGGRNYGDYPTLAKEAATFLTELGWTNPTILSGAASGADRLGEQFAAERGYPVLHFPAKWKEEGRAAGPIRNKQMAQHGDALLAFWDGISRGTSSMIKLAREQGIVVKVIGIRE